jgi:hypothetical protein
MVVAQALGEYAAASAAVEAVSRAWTTVQDHVSGMNSATWMIAGVAFAIVYFIWGRK